MLSFNSHIVVNIAELFKIKGKMELTSNCVNKGG